MNNRSKEIQIKFYINEDEQQLLNELIAKNETTMADYIRDKLFYQNEDISSLNERYIVPHKAKGEIIQVTLMYKMLRLMIKILRKVGYTKEEVKDLDKMSLEYAKEEREKSGYKVIRLDQEVSKDA